MTKSPKRPGRPVKPAKPGQRASLGLRVSGTLKQRIDDAARKTGRTQGQEAEARLERSFHDEALLPQLLELAYGPHLAALLMLMGDAMRATSGSLEAMETWDADPWVFDQVVKAAGQVLDAARPSGEPPISIDEHMRQQRALAGVRAAGQVLDYTFGRDPRELDQRRAAARKLAGSLADRIREAMEKRP
jgi:hypothetical protein